MITGAAVFSSMVCSRRRISWLILSRNTASPRSALAVPEAHTRNRMIEFFMMAGMQFTELLNKLPLAWVIDQSRDFRQAHGRNRCPLEETVVEGAITGNQVLFGMPDLPRKTLAGAFAFIDAGGVQGRNAACQGEQAPLRAEMAYSPSTRASIMSTL